MLPIVACLFPRPICFLHLRLIRSLRSKYSRSYSHFPKRSQTAVLNYAALLASPTRAISDSYISAHGTMHIGRWTLLLILKPNRDQTCPGIEGSSCPFSVQSAGSDLSFHGTSIFHGNDTNQIDQSSFTSKMVSFHQIQVD